MIDVVRRIKKLMDEKKWSIYKLSNETEISTNAIYDWFKGAEPTLNNICKVCNAFKISLGYFFGDGKCSGSADDERILHKWLLLSSSEKDLIMTIIKEFKTH